MKKTIAVIGTFDTKLEEYSFLIDELHNLGAEVLSIDVGTLGCPTGFASVTSEQVAEYANSSLVAIQQANRKDAFTVMLEGIEKCVMQLYEEKKFDGVISMGGSGGTTLATAAMRVLPIGFPKLMVSTLGSSSKIGAYVRNRDIMVLNSVVDISGVNTLTRRIFSEAAGAIVGAANNHIIDDNCKKLRIAASMYGLTTSAVMTAKKYLESRGYEVITFHATGAGGIAMESLIREGFFQGVLDITLPEVSAHVLGVASSTSGASRLGGAAICGIPQVVCPGAMDMVSTTDFSKFGGRKIYCHNSEPSHFRPNEQDTTLIGTYLAQQLNKSTAPCALYLPLLGLSLIDLPGQCMYNPKADRALFAAIKQELNPEVVELHEEYLDINDEIFALMLAKKLESIMTEFYKK